MELNESLLWIGCGVALLATSIGALPALAMKNISQMTNNILMGFSAGVMIAASAFSLILPALDMAKEQFQSTIASAAAVGAAIWLGVLFLFFFDRFVPHEHFVTGREGGVSATQFKRIWLFVFAIALHNVPEGLAIGSGMGSQSLSVAGPIIIGIGLQDLPEGFVVAISLMGAGYSRWQSFGIAILTGVIESLSSVVGFLMTYSVTAILPGMLAFAGGAMVYVVVDEIIPEFKVKSSAREGGLGFMFGFVLMMFLSAALSA